MMLSHFDTVRDSRNARCALKQRAVKKTTRDVSQIVMCLVF